MQIERTLIDGVYSIRPRKIEDERGFFARVWCAREFEEAGINASVVQANLSYNRRRGTLRGLHYQIAPHAETKVVRCTRGAIFDVAVDLREDSPSYLQWVGVELRDDLHNMLVVPEGCAHGFQTLTDDVEVSYQVSAAYAPQAERGARYDDPAFGIEWPLPVAAISDKDARWAAFAPAKGVQA